MTDERYLHEKECCKIVDLFEYRGKTIVIIKMDRQFSSGPWHNGYISTRKSWFTKRYNKPDYQKCNINADEPTFAGFLNRYEDARIPQDMYFVGFDSVHAWNDESNNNQDSVTERAKEFADDMIRARI